MFIPTRYIYQVAPKDDASSQSSDKNSRQMIRGHKMKMTVTTLAIISGGDEYLANQSGGFMTFSVGQQACLLPRWNPVQLELTLPSSAGAGTGA